MQWEHGDLGRRAAHQPPFAAAGAQALERLVRSVRDHPLSTRPAAEGGAGSALAVAVAEELAARQSGGGGGGGVRRGAALPTRFRCRFCQRLMPLLGVAGWDRPGRAGGSAGRTLVLSVLHCLRGG